ncbi:hypothetical protein M501DRAFT_1002822 [Patellaria atrata CBS 101060]|uniref:Pescadillo homolog n=1 Tax=Patellaria atrata CBS 101060 TaxID=1346257 RepID=A0A9P4SD17_9PEZI|nr:hypothetical protein M501DRAFT_1002822 [Patellaria atrata CBS 101060]
MTKIKKKGTSGQAKNFITRTQAVRKLQISLPDFRRLCIFKGIYPREPRNKKKASKGSTASVTFYYTKDIQYLLHDPLLNKIRDHKALSKKISRALGRGEVKDAARLERTHTPKITLDHIIKERYPTFVDALRDLDDCLSMLFLFANLPSTTAVPPKTIALCQRLCTEFEHYLIASHSLRKSFLSIKGIYYQATVQGQDILWLVPYKFVQRVTGDIDFRIMGTFVEFYTTLIGFVNFRLYTSIGLVYPPKFDQKSDDRGGELGAFTLEGKAIGVDHLALPSVPYTNGHAPNGTVSEAAQAQADKIAALQIDNEEQEERTVQSEQEADTVDEKTDTFDPISQDADILPQPQISSSEASTLFSNFTFYLSRETPRHALEFILKAFGCKRVGWDAVLGDGAFTSDESDPTITHQVVDRPNLPLPPIPAPENGGSGFSKSLRPGTRVPGRTYVQPQWIWDCVNQGRLLRPDLYAPGATLPPHLSPWVKPKKGEYDPTAPLAEQEQEGEAEAAELDDEAELEDEEDAEESEDDVDGQPNSITEEEKGMIVALAEEDDDDEDEALGEEWSGVSDSEVETDDEMDTANVANLQHQRELEAEAAGLPFSNVDSAGSTPGKALKAKKQMAKKKKGEEEELERQKMMMSRRKRKLLEKIVYSNNKKEDDAAKLRAKRRKMENAS